MPAQSLESAKGRSYAAATIPINHSSQALIRSTDEANYKEFEPDMKDSGNTVFLPPGSSQDSMLNSNQSKKSPNYVTRTQWITVTILTFVNLINYMDRYTIAGKFFLQFVIPGFSRKNTTSAVALKMKKSRRGTMRIYFELNAFCIFKHLIFSLWSLITNF